MPSYREMAKALGVSAVGTVQDHVRVLVEKGFLEKETKSGVKTGRAINKTLKPRLRLAGARQVSSLSVPLVGEVAAGSLRDAFEVAMGSVAVSFSLLGKPAAKSGDHFALRVRGESMIEAGILPGDIAIVDRKATARSGDFVVAELQGEVTLKELEVKTQSGQRQVRLLPHNATMEPIPVNDPETLRILGKVISLQRFLT